MIRKLKTFILTIIFVVSFSTQTVWAATYYVNTPEEEIIAFNKGMVEDDGDGEFTLDYNVEYNFDIYKFGYENALQDYINSDYTYYNINRIEYRYYHESSKGQKNFSVDYILDLMETPEQKEYVYSTVRSLIKRNPSIIKASNFEKAAWAFDYIVEHVAYDYDYANYTAYEALKEKKAVCQGIVKLYYVMAIELGLNCRIVSGGNHAWNLVELEGKWYYVDATWGACGWGRKYLLKAKKNMTEHSLDPIYKDYFDFAEADYEDKGTSGYRGILASVYGVEFDLLKRINLTEGVTYEWMLNNPKNIKLEFSSDDSEVATVSRTGIISGIGEGVTTVRAKNEELGIEQTCEVIVGQVEPVVTGFKDISVTFNKSGNIKLEIAPKGAKLQNVSYKSKDKSIATVDNKGKVTGIRVGSTTIEVTYGDKKKIKIPVTVKPAVNSKYKSITVEVKKTKNIQKAVAVSDKGYKDLTFQSTNTAVAKVSSTGKVTGVKKGSCSIKIYDKVTKKKVATVKVTVK